GARIETVGARQGPLAADGLMRESVIYIELESINAKARQELLPDLEDILAEVRAAVADWPSMLSAQADATVELRNTPPPVSEGEQAEAVAFLESLSRDYFTLLGYRFYRYDGDLGD